MTRRPSDTLISILEGGFTTVAEPAGQDVVAELEVGLGDRAERSRGPNCVISILRGGFTTVERTLIDEGDVDTVYAMRRSFRDLRARAERGALAGRA